MLVPPEVRCSRADRALGVSTRHQDHPWARAVAAQGAALLRLAEAPQVAIDQGYAHARQLMEQVLVRDIKFDSLDDGRD